MTASAAAAAAGESAAGERTRLLLFGGTILLLINFAAPVGGLVGVPISFFLKNRLHLRADELALFNLITSIPLYVAFLFGLARDRWSPLRAGDRGHLVLFGAATALVFAAFAFVAPTWAGLVIGVTLATALLQMVGAAANGLMAAAGQARAMAGEASAAINIAACAPAVAGYALGGLISSFMEGERADAAARTLFLGAAAIMAASALMAAAGSRRLYAAGEARPKLTLFADLGRLASARAIWPPLLMLLLWDFAPASGAVMQYHLADALRASDAQVGLFYALFYAFNLPPLFAYAWLCRRVRLSRLLLVATLIAVWQWTPLIAIHTVNGALWAAMAGGLMGGLASAAYLDLAIRACPAGLQGTLMMLVVSTLYYVAARLGDLWGARIYAAPHGFAWTVVATMAVYALILPLLALAPGRLTAQRDGEAVSRG